MKKLFSLLLAALLLLSLSPAALAAAQEEAGEPRVVERKIETTADFLRFARSCARESFSSGVRFVLETDVDLSGTDFESIPYFAGEFDGGGHTIAGLAVTRAGSRLGLFRTIGAEAAVHDLKVEGRVTPDGTREYIGGLCGVNEGTVKDCSFSGEVRGVNNVGGLIGLNTGTATGCGFDGLVCGEHQVGGVAGKNAGMLFNCENRGAVNTEEITPAGEKSFDLSALSQDDFVDLSDIGGVAGENTGSVRFCRGKGDVGWHYTGYNVGGIVGKNSGFVDNCRSEGSVEGRRDVGGVVGQSVPYLAWELSEGKLKDLEKAIAALNGLLGAASSTIGSMSSTLSGQLQNMSAYSTQAMSAVSQLLGASLGQTSNYLAGISVDPVTGEITLPNANYAAADTSALTAALNNLFAQVRVVSGALEESVGASAEDLRRINGQMSYIFNLLFSMMNELGSGDLISTRDLSLDEAYDHDEGAVARCENRGSVRAETNAGGVVGCVAFELSFDKEDSLGTADFLPTQAEQLLFAVVRGCKNSGRVQSRGDCAGGIVGRMDAGAAVDCVSTAVVSAQSGSYVGGIAGEAGGTLARCISRCSLEGARYVGGAAGLGTNVADCRAWTHIARAEEYAGALAGWCEGEVSGNLYVADGPEGVDGVGRLGQAEPMTRSELLATDGLPAGFENVTVRFYVDDDVYRTISVPFGGALETLPQVDEKGGAAWVWDEFDSSALYCDTDVYGAYLEPIKTLASGEEFPLFLVEGEFYAGQSLDVQPSSDAPEQGESLGGYTLTVDGFEGVLTVRMRSDGGAAVYARGADGSWRELESEWDGRYLVFGLPNGGSFAVMAVQQRPDALLWAAGGAAALLIALLVWRALRRGRQKRQTPPETPAEEAPEEPAGPEDPERPEEEPETPEEASTE
ncbi:MAG: hypothetical protein IJP64_01360 [Oscillospiraceae bacterium]|nr:hypothetical protein [Oscillospiraceae bacterium]